MKRRKAQKDRRENILRIRVTDAERKELDDAAQTSGGLDTSTWARHELLGTARKLRSKRPPSLASEAELS